MYALVQSGVVVELYTPPSGYTIDECFPASLASQFVAVPSGVSPAQGWLYSNGTFSAPPAAPPSVVTAYGNFLAGGLNITFTDSPALTGTYAIDPATQQKITSVSVYINQYRSFPYGDTQVWPLLNNTTVTFTNVYDFQAFAQLVAQQVAQADIALATGNLNMPQAILTLAPPTLQAAPFSPTPIAAGTATG